MYLKKSRKQNKNVVVFSLYYKIDPKTKSLPFLELASATLDEIEAYLTALRGARTPIDKGE